MKKIGKFVLALIVLISLIGCKSKEEKMLDYMEKKYGEEFVLGFAGGRGDTLIVQTIPKRYLGTPKERDKYYRGQIFYERNDIGDDYGAVLLKESTNEYFRPKLEELFEKNILIALDLEGQYFHTDFVKEMNRRKENRKIYGEVGTEPPLSGGIYIFGRVESEEDREKYRRGIYEFIQYLKQEGMFEYVDVVIRIYDERCLTLSYKEVTSKLKEERKIQKNSTDYKKVREKILSTLTKEYSQMIEKEKQEKLNNIIKSDMVDEKGWTNDYSYAQIYQYVIWSPKFLKNTPNTLLKSYKPIEYKNIKEIKLLDSFKIDYHEYDEKALYNNEWGD